MFILMCDDKEIAHAKKTDTESVMVLMPGIPAACTPFGLFRDSNEVPMLDVIKWFEDRAFPEERVDCERLLDELGLDRYDAWEIVKKTRGTLMTDYFWLKIEPGDTYENCSLRGAAGFAPVSFN